MSYTIHDKINLSNYYFLIIFVIFFLISDPFDEVIRRKVEEQQKGWHKIINDSKMVVSNDGE